MLLPLLTSVNILISVWILVVIPTSLLDDFFFGGILVWIITACSYPGALGEYLRKPRSTIKGALVGARLLGLFVFGLAALLIFVFKAEVSGWIIIGGLIFAVGSLGNYSEYYQRTTLSPNMDLLVEIIKSTVAILAKFFVIFSPSVASVLIALFCGLAISMVVGLWLARFDVVRLADIKVGLVKSPVQYLILTSVFLLNKIDSFLFQGDEIYLILHKVGEVSVAVLAVVAIRYQRKFAERARLIYGSVRVHLFLSGLAGLGVWILVFLERVVSTWDSVIPPRVVDLINSSWELVFFVWMGILASFMNTIYPLVVSVAGRWLVFVGFGFCAAVLSVSTWMFSESIFLLSLARLLVFLVLAIFMFLIAKRFEGEVQ